MEIAIAVENGQLVSGFTPERIDEFKTENTSTVIVDVSEELLDTLKTVHREKASQLLSQLYTNN